MMEPCGCKGLVRVLLVVSLLGMISGFGATQTPITGAGATFPYPIYSKWFSEYQKAHPEVAL